MKYIKNQDGIALLTALMFTFICLTMILCLLYTITQGIQTSASNKRYKTAREASYGGAEIALKEVIPQIFQNNTSSQVTGSFSTINLQLPASSSCLQQKLRLPQARWDASCSASLNPKTSPDMTMQLKSTGADAQPYSVYTKIVDTVPGNTDTSGLQLEGSGVAEASTTITPQHYPYIYRVEVEAEKATAAKEKGSLSIQYAY